jgi:hypothetical protein
MRFLVREQPYERLLAAGRFVYRQEGQPTGAVEAWRLTAARETYRFLRVDLDARAAESGDSYLYHLVLDGNRPVRLTFRFWGGPRVDHPSRRIEGNAYLEPDEISVGWEVDGRRREASLPLETPWAFWFPSTAGLGLLGAHVANGAPARGCWLDPAADFAPQAVSVTAEQAPGLSLDVGGQPRPVTHVTLSWDGQRRQLWLDEDDFVLRMVRPDLDLEAVETEYVRHA